MVIMPLDYRTYCARPALINFWDFGESCAIVKGITSDAEIAFQTYSIDTCADPTSQGLGETSEVGDRDIR